MPKEDKNILKYDYGQKSVRIRFIIYVDMESLLDEIDTCHSNPEQLSTAKINKHTASGYSRFMRCSFDITKNKHDYYRGKDGLKNFCKDLEKHGIKIISYEKGKIPLTNEENKSYQEQSICHICKKDFSNNDKKHKVRDHCHYTGRYISAPHNFYNPRYKTLKQ